jgi:YVTN family beta-propeller protein
MKRSGTSFGTARLAANVAGALALLAGAGPVQAATPRAPHCAGTAYTANTGDNTLSVIDMSTDRVIATIPVGKGPAIPIFTRDGRRAYVNNSADDTISEIDPVAHRVIRTIALPKGYGGSGFALSPDGRHAVTTKITYPAQALIVDLQSGRATGPIEVGNGSERVAISADGRLAYVADGDPKADHGSIRILDLASATVIKTVPVGKFPFNLVVMPDGKTVYVANVLGSSISVLDTATNTIVQTIPTAPYPNGLALSHDGRTIYITNFAGGTMQTLDLATRKVSAPIPTSARPSYIALSPDGAQAYYVHPTGNTVSVVDTRTFGLASTITVGKAPTAIGACPFAGAPRTVAAAPAPATPAAASRARFSVETTPLGELLDTPATRAVLLKHAPSIATNPRIAEARGLTLGVLQSMSSDLISSDTLAAIDADLARITAP